MCRTLHTEYRGSLYPGSMNCCWKSRGHYSWLMWWYLNCRAFGFGYFILWKQAEKTVSAHYQERNYCGKCFFVALCCCQIWCRGKLLNFNLLNRWLLSDLICGEKQPAMFSYKLSFTYYLIIVFYLPFSEFENVGLKKTAFAMRGISFPHTPTLPQTSTGKVNEYTDTFAPVSVFCGKRLWCCAKLQELLFQGRRVGKKTVVK